MLVMKQFLKKAFFLFLFSFKRLVSLERKYFSRHRLLVGYAYHLRNIQKASRVTTLLRLLQIAFSGIPKRSCLT